MKYKDKVRLVTWNIGGAYISNDDHKSYSYSDIAYFLDVLKEVSPDIVCLQEAHVSADLNQPAWLAEKLGLYMVSHAYDDSHLLAGCQLSVAILSRWAPLQPEFVMLPNPHLKLGWKGEKVVSHNKGFLLAEINLAGQYLHVASGHLLPFHRFGRSLEDTTFNAIRERIEALFLQEKADALIGADMNCADLSAGLPELMRHYACVPFDLTRPDGRVTDHILYSKSWHLVRGWTVQTHADHHLCVADLTLSPPVF